MKGRIMLLAAMAIVAIAAGMAISASPGEAGGAQNQITAPPKITTEQLTFGNSNYRFPGVGQDSKGNTLVIFRGPEGTQFYYMYRPKGGVWTSPASIGVQPSLVSSNYYYRHAYVRVDSADRFHCAWEDLTSVIYAVFQNGVWTTLPRRILATGVYDVTFGMDLRSTDEMVVSSVGRVGVAKDIYLNFKRLDESWFRSPVNITNDPVEGSTQPTVAVDSKDHCWVAWKSDEPIPGVEENLVIFLAEFDLNNKYMHSWYIASQNPGWAFLPQVAVNSEDKVMTIWAQQTAGQYMSNLFDPVSRKMGPIISLELGFPPIFHTFFSKLTDRGKDFYAAVISTGRILHILKYNFDTAKWDTVVNLEQSAEMVAINSGPEHVLVAWNSAAEPSQIYLTSVEAPPLSKKLTIEAGTGGTTDPAPGTYTQNVNSSVTVTATPNTGYRFGSWTGDATGTSPSITVTMSSDVSIKANFVETPLLTVQTTAGGTTTPAPGTYRYDIGTTVTLASSTNANYEFTGWTGDATGTAASITFNLDRDMIVKANYALQPVLTVQAGFGGTTNPVPGTYRYNTGTQVSVRAVPDAAYYFVNWTGDAPGTANPTTVTMTGDKTIKGNYALRVQSPINVAAAKKTERGFFNARYLNVVTWQANPLNAERGVNVTSQKLYRKARSAANSAWTLIKTIDNGTTLTYEDRYVERASDYVYAVSCIDAYGNESSYY